MTIIKHWQKHDDLVARVQMLSRVGASVPPKFMGPTNAVLRKYLMDPINIARTMTHIDPAVIPALDALERGDKLMANVYITDGLAEAKRTSEEWSMGPLQLAGVCQNFSRYMLWKTLDSLQGYLDFTAGIQLNDAKWWYDRTFATWDAYDAVSHETIQACNEASVEAAKEFIREFEVALRAELTAWVAAMDVVERETMHETWPKKMLKFYNEVAL